MKMVVEVELEEKEIVDLLTGDDPECPPFTTVAWQVAGQVRTLALRGELGEKPLRMVKQMERDLRRAQYVRERVDEGLNCFACYRNIEGQESYPLSFPKVPKARLCVKCQQVRRATGRVRKRG